MRYNNSNDEQVNILINEQMKELEKYNVEDWLASEESIGYDGGLRYAQDLEYSYYYVDIMKGMGRIQNINFSEEDKLLEYHLIKNKQNRVPSVQVKKSDGTWTTVHQEFHLDYEYEDEETGETVNIAKDKVAEDEQIKKSATYQYIQSYELDRLMNNNLLTDKQKQFIKDMRNGEDYLYSRRLKCHYLNGIRKRIEQSTTYKPQIIRDKKTKEDNNMIKAGRGVNYSFDELNRQEIYVLRKFVVCEDAIKESDINKFTRVTCVESVINNLIKLGFMYYYSGYYGATKKGIDKIKTYKPLITRESIINNFIDDIYRMTGNDKDVIKAKDMYEDYKIYCQLRDYEALGKKQFYMELKESCDIEKKPDNHKSNIFTGIIKK